MSKNNPKELTIMQGAAAPRPDAPLSLRELIGREVRLDYDIAVMIDRKLHHVKIHKILRDAEFPNQMGTIVLTLRGLK